MNVYGEWAASGSISIMKNRGQINNQTEGVLHYGAVKPNDAFSGLEYKIATDFSAEWHVFTIEWDVNEIRFFVDTQQYYKESLKRNFWSKKGTNPYTKDGQPFDQAFYWILDVGVGGSYFPPATYGVLTVEESKQWLKPTMDVEYVRVYEWK